MATYTTRLQLIVLCFLALLTTPLAGQTLATLPQGTWNTDVRAIDLTVTGSSLTASSCTGAGVGIQDRVDAALALDGNLTHKVTINVGATPCSGQFTYGPKTGANPSGSGWVYIVTDSAASLPVAGTRVADTDTQYMPKIVTTNTTTGGIRILAGAHHGYFDGVYVTNSLSVQLLLNLDPGATLTANYPHHLVFRRSIIKGDLTVGADVVTGRCVAIGANYVAFLDSRIDSCVRTSLADTQTFGGWNFAGPLVVDNNFLGSSTEHFIFGGSVPVGGFVNDARGIVPSDIWITRNYFTKTYGLGYYYKNFWECKNCQRVLLEGNLTYDYRAGGGQNYALQWTPSANNVITKTIAASPTGLVEVGNTVTVTTTANHTYVVGDKAIIRNAGDAAYNVEATILTTPTTTTFTFTHGSSGLGASGGGTTSVLGAPQAVVQDITVRLNHFKKMSAWSNHNYASPSAITDWGSAGNAVGVDCSGYPTQKPQFCLRARRQTFEENLIDGVSGSVNGGEGKFIQMLGPIDHYVNRHNTYVGDGTGSVPTLILLDGVGSLGGTRNVFENGFYWSHNLSSKYSLGANCPTTTNGTLCLNYVTTGYSYTWDHNVVVGATSGYPAGNGNQYPAGPMPAGIRFVNWIAAGGGDYRLCTGVDLPVVGCPGASPYLDMGDGSSAGISDQAVWLAATCGAETGDWSTASGHPCATAGSPAPTVTSLNPATGAYTGATPVTITGTGFQIGATVGMPGALFSCTSVVVVNSTSITCSTPAHAAGVVDVVVTNPDAQLGTCSGCYTYTGSGAATISGFTPTTASFLGGTPLLITGTNFAQGAEVTVGGVTCGSVSVVSSTSMYCTLPAITALGAKSVVVTNPSASPVTAGSTITYTNVIVTGVATPN